MYFPAYSGEAKLISWVPPELNELVDYAMRCNAEECFTGQPRNNCFREKLRWNKLVFASIAHAHRLKFTLEFTSDIERSASALKQAVRTILDTTIPAIVHCYDHAK